MLRTQGFKYVQVWYNFHFIKFSGVPRGGGLECSNPPPPQTKALQNRAKLNPICENC